MQLDQETLIRLGSDARWLFAGLKVKSDESKGESAGFPYPRASLLAEALEHHLGRTEAELRLPQATILSTTSRQIAIRQHLSSGILSAFSPDTLDRNSRRIILRKIQVLLHVHEGHANRVMNGLGIFAKDLGTEQLADHYIGRNSNFIRELDVDLIQLLACGAGENLGALLLKPYQFFANSACAALRLRLEVTNEEDLFRLKQDVKKKFPPFTNIPPRPTHSALQVPTPETQISLYGLAMWQSAGTYLHEDSRLAQKTFPLDEAKLSQVIRLATTEAPWVFPELFQIELGSLAKSTLSQDSLVQRAVREQHERLISAQTDKKYLQVVRDSITTIGLEVGKALCGMEPYGAILGES